MPNLRHFLLLFGGFAIGFAVAKFPTSPELSPPSRPTTPAKTESSQNVSEQNSPERNSDTPDGKEIFPSTTASMCPEAPVCPCLFSDKILPAPEFAHDLKATLESNFEGEVLVKWTPVNGAKRYEVRLESPTGEALKTHKTPRTILYLKDIPLPPGKFEADYNLRLVSVN